METNEEITMNPVIRDCTLEDVTNIETKIISVIRASGKPMNSSKARNYAIMYIDDNVEIVDFADYVEWKREKTNHVGGFSDAKIDELVKNYNAKKEEFARKRKAKKLAKEQKENSPDKKDDKNPESSKRIFKKE